MFADDRYITITAAYETGANSQPSLDSMAPELKDAGLRLVAECGGPRPSRVWTGVVDHPTYERFAAAWQLPPEIRDGASAAPYFRTYDGLNWETDGRSPIIYVSLSVSSPRWARHRMAGQAISRT